MAKDIVIEAVKKGDGFKWITMKEYVERPGSPSIELKSQITGQELIVDNGVGKINPAIIQVF